VHSYQCLTIFCFPLSPEIGGENVSGKTTEIPVVCSEAFSRMCCVITVQCFSNSVHTRVTTHNCLEIILIDAQHLK